MTARDIRRGNGGVVRPRPMDLIFEDHGSIWLARPLTQRAVAWLADTAPEDAQFLGSAMAVEPRYVDGVCDAARAAGLRA